MGQDGLRGGGVGPRLEGGQGTRARPPGDRRGRARAAAALLTDWVGNRGRRLPRAPLGHMVTKSRTTSAGLGPAPSYATRFSGQLPLVRSEERRDAVLRAPSGVDVHA